MNPRGETSIRSDRLTQCAFEREKVIRRSASRISSWPAVKGPRQQAGHMTAPSEGRLRRKNLANRAVPHMSQTPIPVPIDIKRGSTRNTACVVVYRRWLMRWKPSSIFDPARSNHSWTITSNINRRAQSPRCIQFLEPGPSRHGPCCVSGRPATDCSGHKHI